MFASRDFLSCIEQQLTQRGFGKKRQRAIEDNFHGLTGMFQREGYGPQVAQSMAMNKVFADLAKATAERAKRTMHDLQVHASNAAVVEKGAGIAASQWVMDGGSGKGAGVVRAAISLLQHDPRFGNQDVENARASLRDKYHALLGDAMDKFRKGFMGTQKGKADLPDLVREIYGEKTGNINVEAVAHAYDNLDKVMVADHVNAGGSMNALEKYIPQPTNNAVAARTSKAEFIADATRLWDWNKIAFSDGTPVPASDRARLIEVIHDTFSQGGANRIEPAEFGGRGVSVGNSLDNHRFIQFSKANDWLEWNAKYGGGSNIVDLITGHIENMAHKTSLIQTFGTNPQAGIENLKNVTLKKAGAIQKAAMSARDRLADGSSVDVKADKKLANKYDLRAVAEAEKTIKARMDPMYNVYTRANPLDKNSPLGATVLATSNIIASAKLGSTMFLAQGGDMAQTLAMRMLNHQDLLSGMGHYLSGMTTDFKGRAEMMARGGFIFDSHIASTNTTERFSPIASYGPAWSRRVSSWNMRLSGLDRHTEIARATVQQEMMGALMHHSGDEFDNVPLNQVMARYGIGPAEWDAVRKNTPAWEPEAGAKFLRPLDILQTNLANKDSLYSRFYTMVAQEAKNAVPGSTLEAGVALKNTSRPDTLPGALLHSFATFKNFPITFMQMYGRLALSETDTASRLKFLAAIGLGATMVGAMGTQMKEISQGRTPIPMGLNANGKPNAAFWGKALLAGGGMGIWGDFLFNGVNQQGQGPAEVAAGPLAGLAHDAANLAFGGPFKMVTAWENDEQNKADVGHMAVQFAKYNTPFTSLWYTRLALEREVWDALDLMVSPQARQRNAQQARQQQKNFGNSYYSLPGSGLSGNGPAVLGGLR